MGIPIPAKDGIYIKTGLTLSYAIICNCFSLVVGRQSGFQTITSDLSSGGNSLLGNNQLRYAHTCCVYDSQPRTPHIDVRVSKYKDQENAHDLVYVGVYSAG